MIFSFHREAEDELVDAVGYYEACDVGLGIDFSREVYATIQNVIDYPTMWPKIEDEVHRCLVHRFPFGVLYSVEADAIFILAVMQQAIWCGCSNGRETTTRSEDMRRRLMAPNEILEAALEKEKQAHDFYAEMGANCPVTFVKDLLLTLQNEEAKHIHMIQKMLAQMESG